MSTITVSFAAIEATLVESAAQARSRMMDLVSEDQMEPTWDANGRGHAPCDNYIFDDRSYAAGQYLHDPDVAGSSTARAKVMVDLTVAKQLIDLLRSHGAEATPGKNWETNGSSFCYVYVEGPGRVVNVLKKMVPEGGRMLVQVQEGVETGRTWKTTLGKLQSKLCPVTFEPFEAMEESLLSQVYGWVLAPKKKTVSVEVGYTYRTYCVC